MKVIVHKGKEGLCIEKGPSIIYKGPFKHIADDDNHRIIKVVVNVVSLTIKLGSIKVCFLFYGGFEMIQNLADFT